jgi:hypothetical protein
MEEREMEDRLNRFAEALVTYEKILGSNGNEKASEDEKRRILRMMEEGVEADVFEYMIYTIMVGSSEIPSEELVKRIADYLWVNVSNFQLFIYFFFFK